MQQFINAKETSSPRPSTNDRSSGGSPRLDGYPHIKVVLRVGSIQGRAGFRRVWARTKPSGFVGQGMLTAAVCGMSFLSFRRRGVGRHSRRNGELDAF